MHKNWERNYLYVDYITLHLENRAVLKIITNKFCKVAWCKSYLKTYIQKNMNSDHLINIMSFNIETKKDKIHNRKCVKTELETLWNSPMFFSYSTIQHCKDANSLKYYINVMWFKFK